MMDRMKSRGRAASAVVLLAAVAVVAMGCSSAAAPPKVESSAEGESHDAELVDVTPKGNRHVFGDFQMAVDYPSHWHTAPTDEAERRPGVAELTLLDGTDAPQLQLNRGGLQGLGGACTPDLPLMQVSELDATPAKAPGFEPGDPAGGEELTELRFVYRIGEFDGGVVTSMALTNQPVVDSCMFYNLISGADGLMAFADSVQVDTYSKQGFFASRAEAEAYMQTPEYETKKLVLLSLSFDPSVLAEGEIAWPAVTAG